MKKTNIEFALTNLPSCVRVYVIKYTATFSEESPLGLMAFTLGVVLKSIIYNITRIQNHMMSRARVKFRRFFRITTEIRLLIAMGGKLSYPQVELKDKVAIVTGGNTGIGYETAKALAIMGAHTIIACRSEERGQQVSPSELVCQFYSDVCCS